MISFALLGLKCWQEFGGKKLKVLLWEVWCKRMNKRIKVFHNSFNEKAIGSGRISIKPRMSKNTCYLFLMKWPVPVVSHWVKFIINYLRCLLSWPLTRLHYCEQKFPPAQSSRENKWKIAFHQIVFDHHLEPPCSGGFAELAWWSLIECWAEMDQISRLQIILPLLSNSTPSQRDCKCHVQTTLKDPPFTFKFQCFWHLHCKTMKWIFFENVCKRHVTSSLSPAATFQKQRHGNWNVILFNFPQFSCLPCVSANRE